MYNYYAQMTLLPPVYRAVLKGQRHTGSSRYSQDLENFLFIDPPIAGETVLTISVGGDVKHVVIVLLFSIRQTRV